MSEYDELSPQKYGRTVRITVSDEQRTRLKAILRMIDEADSRGHERSIMDYIDMVTENKKG